MKRGLKTLLTTILGMTAISFLTNFQTTALVTEDKVYNFEQGTVMGWGNLDLKSTQPVSYSSDLATPTNKGMLKLGIHFDEKNSSNELSAVVWLSGIINRDFDITGYSGVLFDAFVPADFNLGKLAFKASLNGSAGNFTLAETATCSPNGILQKIGDKQYQLVHFEGLFDTLNDKEKRGQLIITVSGVKTSYNGPIYMDNIILKKQKANISSSSPTPTPTLKASVSSATTVTPVVTSTKAQSASPLPTNQAPKEKNETIVDTGKLLKDLDSKENMIVEITAKEKLTAQNIILDGSVLKKAESLNKKIKIKSSAYQFEIPSNLKYSEKDSLKVNIGLTDLKETDKRYFEATMLSVASNVNEFSMEVSSSKVERVNSEFEVSLQADLKQFKDTSKFVIYRFNGATKSWDFVSSKCDRNGKVVFKTKDFGKFVVVYSKKSFRDIDSHWAKDSIEVMAAHNIANGKGENLFCPNENVTRAEFATMLANALRLTEKSNGVTFKDIKAGMWYEDAVNRAFTANIISGYGENRFIPNLNITREQMAVMIVNAYKSKKQQETKVTANSKFNDDSGISDWARASVYFAMDKKFMSGFPEGIFKPDENATRAQAVTAIRKLIENLEII